MFLRADCPDQAGGCFAAWSPSLSARFLPGKIEYRLAGSAFELSLLGSANVAAEAGEMLAGHLNRLSGAGGSESIIDVPLFSSVRYPNIYPGIDLEFRSEGGSLKTEFRVAAGVDPAIIRLHYSGAAVSVAAGGALSIRVPAGEVREPRPVVYQEPGHVLVAADFVMKSDGCAGFGLGAYDQARALIIDPALSYSAVINGSRNTAATAIASDAVGNVYVAGWTDSSDLPIAGAEQAIEGGGNDAFVMKLNGLGNAIVYATFLGGVGDDRAFGIAVDAAGEAVVVGWTQSANFPALSAIQPVLSGGSGQDAFVTKLNAAGNGLIFSTFLGGAASDTANAVALNAQGQIWVTGDTQSLNFPLRAPIQAACGGRQDVFVAELSAAGALIFSTYIGGNGDDHGAAIAVDVNNFVLVAGSTYSTNFPTLHPFQAANAGGQDAFLLKIAPGGTLVSSTYLGGSGGSPALPEGATGVAADLQGNMYVAGTTSSQNFPVYAALQGPHPYGTDAFLAKFNPQGTTMIYGTYLGGSGYDYATAMLVDGTGCAYVAGQTSSWDLPTVYPYQATLAGMYDGFAVKVNAAGTALEFATYIGGNQNDEVNGMAVDHQGNLYLAGQTSSTNFPEVGGIVPRGVGGVQAFVVSLNGAGDHAPFLNRGYRGFFNRLPDPGGLAFWTQQMDSGTAAAQVGTSFLTTPETTRNDFSILEAYLGMLNSEPAFVTLAAMLSQFESAALASPGCLAGPAPYNTVAMCSQLTLIAQLLGAPAFQAQYGALNNTQFVQIFLTVLLGSAPSQSTVSTWASALNSGTSTRGQFIQSWLNSNQYVNSVTIRIQVDLAYYGFLLRAPDPNGAAGWQYFLSHGASLSALAAAFVGCNEFKNGI